MRNALNFVRGAVATKDIVPILTHLHVYDSRIQGSNGRVTIDAPCPDLKGFDFTVPMMPFLKAVDACDGEPNIKQREGFIDITYKKFKATLPLENHENYPRQERNGGESHSMTASILKTLNVILPFISEDASRPWSCGVLFKDGNAFATNNAILVKMPAYAFPYPLNLPVFLVDEILRIKQDPTEVYSDGNSITFVYKDSSWCKSVLSALDWPDVFRMIPEEVPSGTKILPDLIEAVEKILPFCPDAKIPIIVIGPEGISTNEGDKSAAIGGFELPVGKYRAENLLRILRASTIIDLTPYPKMASFAGPDGFRGVTVGVI